MLFAIIAQTANAQGFLAQKDLSQFKVEMLSEADISKIKERLQSSELSIDQIKTQTSAKGLPAAEFEKLRTRLSATNNTVNNIGNKLDNFSNNRSMQTGSDSLSKTNIEQSNPIFGSELFQNAGSLTSNANIATPLNYEVGPNDILKLVLYGIQEFATELKVSYEGSVTVQNVGVIRVAGLTIEAATDKIRQQMARTAYVSLRTGESKLSVTLSNIRTIHVTIIGAKKPGTYDLSSLSTVFSALSLAGGPSPIGSYRNIELVRNNKVIRKVDLYHFILNGDQTDNIGLKDNDVIRIPAYENRVELNGQVKRPGIFELTGKENFQNILAFAGGFDEAAYTSNVKVIQKNGRELLVKDLGKEEFASYAPQGGDVYVVSKILNRYQNRVKLTGAVYRPDTYQLVEGMRVSDLIKKADGLKEDAYTGGAQLFRLKPNLVKEMVNIDLTKALAGDKTENIYLQREDELYVSSVLDLRDSFNVKIFGEVHNPGKFTYADSMTVKDLITLAGGSTFAANKKVEVARLYKQQDGKVNNTEIATLLTTELDANLNFTPGNSDIILQPYDVVSIVKKVGFAENQIVSITGQVQFAGKYSLISRVERVSDVLKRAGGLIGDAYAKGAFIKRESIKADTVSQVMKDSLKKLGITYELPSNVQNIALDIDQILKNLGSYYDLVLSDKDEIVIPKLDNKITIRGGVLRPVTITYHEGITLGECISAAGGITENARRNKAYVVYYNGRSKRTKTFGFFRFNPRIEPGSEVVLPEGTVRKDAMTTILQYVTILAQIGTSLATLQLLAK
ncbi:MAG: SLBB domain-containing protein [Bacteroidetes bacterium]|nr:SLBB domain-containing protein [Bacteroidota bacterium]